ncbi:S8 family serine peptidase [bacterium]|nr:S8 family serine peptidase [bacterium]
MRNPRIRDVIGWIVFLYLILYFSGYADSPRNHKNPKFDAALSNHLAISKSNEQIPVIIIYNSSNLRPRIGTIRYSYERLPMIAATMTADQISEVAKDPQVKRVEFDQEDQLFQHKERIAFGVESVRSQFQLTGDGDGNNNHYSSNDVVIAIIDTGIDAGHPDLKNKVLYWKDVKHHKKFPYDDRGHGTFVAGIAAGAGGGAHQGVAPGAALVIVKAFGIDGTSTRSLTLAAVDEVIKRKSELNIRILNCSFGSKEPSDGADSMSVAATRAIQSGITVIAAAGNSGLRKTIGSPAAADPVIAVGAGGVFGGSFFIAGFSSRGPVLNGHIKPDLWAPGYNITSTRPGGGYTSGSGTSFSTPFVSGVAALMLQANAHLTPDAIKQILTSTAERWSPGVKSNETGFGRLQAYQAITSAMNSNQASNPPPKPALIFQKAKVKPGETFTKRIQVDSADYALAVTAIILNFDSEHSDKTDLAIEIIDPDGHARSVNSSWRQETIFFRLTTAGEYEIRITASGDSPCSFQLNVSTDLTEILSQKAHIKVGNPPYIYERAAGIRQGTGSQNAVRR